LVKSKKKKKKKSKKEDSGKKKAKRSRSPEVGKEKARKKMKPGMEDASGKKVSDIYSSPHTTSYIKTPFQMDEDVPNGIAHKKSLEAG